MNATRPPALDVPKVSPAEPVRRIRGVSTFALDLLASAANIAFVTADSFSRPLAAAGLWPSRAKPFLSADDTINLLFALAASGTSEALKAVETLKLMVLRPGSSPPPSARHTSFPPGAAYSPFLSTGGSLYFYLTGIVAGLTKVSQSGRTILGQVMKDLHWELEICPEAPFFATIRYAERPSLLAFNAMEFRPSAEFLSENNGDAPGIARVIKIPFSVLIAATEAVLESDRRAAAAQSRTTKPAGRRRSASSAPGMEKVAGPDDHSDLSNHLQPEEATSKSIVGRQPSNERTHEVSNEQSKASSISVQRLGSLRLVHPPRKTSQRAFAPSGAVPDVQRRNTPRPSRRAG